MNFVARIPQLVYETDPKTVSLQYKLPDKFFYLPNQFWKHKNHIIVLEALRILQNRNIRPFVVFTGNLTDARNPTFYTELTQKVSLWDLNDQVAFLGLVPHEDVYLLIRQSICMLNPSLFEGWSTTVEEAKSVGKRVLLSDLAVHREQAPPAAVYFDPHNAEDLANKVEELWKNVSPGPDIELERKAREDYPIRMKNYADAFVSIAYEAVDIARGKSPGTSGASE
jgi:glycosyltransferase involved in cell wall biosynthesis